MLAELRRQLTEEDAALTNLRARLESDLQRRRRPTGGRDASASESPASRYDVYATSDGSARQRFDDVFRFFSQGRGAVTPETFQAAAKELGLDLNTTLAKSVFNVDPEVYSAVELAGVDLSQQPSSIGIENFVRWWHFSTKPAAVLTRSAWTRRQTEQAAANRGGYRDPHRDADPEWSPVKKLRASVSVGHVEGMEAKSSIHIVALPSNQQNFTDVVDELRDKTANPDGDDEADTLTAEQLVAVASLRLPVNPNVEDEHVQECLELFRAAAEEFNAQNEFPVATRIGLVNSTKGYGKDFVIAVFTRTTALNEELPFVKFFAVLELLQEVGSPVGTQPFFEQISLGIDFGTSAADVLKLGGGAPLAQLTRTARLAFAASLTDEIIDAVHQHIVALAPKAQIQHAGTFLPRAVKGLNAEMHFDTAEDVLDASLDVLEDLALRERVVALGLGATEAKIVEAQQKVRQIRHNFRGALTSEIQFDVKVADAFGASKVARLFGADREVVAPLSIYGSSNLDLAWFVHCLEFPAADQLTQPEAAVVDDKLGKTGPFQFQLPGKLDDGSVRTLPVVALTFADAVQAVTSNGLLVALVNVTSNATLVRDLGELQRATATKAGPMVIVAYSAPDRFATGASPDLDKLQALCEEALPSRNVLQVFQWRCGQSLDRARTFFVENCEVQEEGNDDDQGEGSSMKEIIKTILYAFRKVTTGPSELSVVTHDAEVTAKLIGIPLFNVLPASKAEANAAVAAARHSVRSQRYFKHAVFSSSNNNDMVPRDATPAGRDSSSSSDGSDAEVSGDDRKVRANRTPSDDDSASNGADESD